MPTIMSHAVAAAAVTRALTMGRRLPLRFWTLCAILAIVPDIDIVAFAFRLPPGSMWAHRGITHSLSVAAVTGGLVGVLAGGRLVLSVPKLGLCFVAAMASHGVLDAFTNGGSGVAFFAPFDATRYVAPWRPIVVSPIGIAFFSEWGARTLLSELGWIWLPAAVVLVLVEGTGRAARPSGR